MPPSTCEQRLGEALERMEIIDAHEHLPAEEVRVQAPADVFTLFSHYTRNDLLQAGMSPEDYKGLFDRERPLEARWRTFAPYWEQVRWTCFSRPALAAAKRFYGCDDINERTYGRLSEAIAQANTPGIYDRVLRQACRIRCCLTNAYDTAVACDLLRPVLWPPLMFEVRTWEDVHHPSFAREAEIGSLDEYLDAAGRYVREAKAAGAVAFKMKALPYAPPDRREAEACFERLKAGAQRELPSPGGTNPLRDYLVDEFIGLAGAAGMVVAVHTGFLSALEHHRPRDVTPLLLRHPEVRFDVYHVGFPRVREALVLAKCLPNVWTNFCGTYLLSERFARAALEEAVDLLPASRIIAFGGDYGSPYGVPVEKVYGHLAAARRTVAAVLAGRVERGQMTEDRAVALAGQWFRENPRELYRLAP